MDVWHCGESDVAANPQDDLRFPAVSLRQGSSVSALALLDVVVTSRPLADLSTTSSSATQPLHLEACADRHCGRAASGRIRGSKGLVLAAVAHQGRSRGDAQLWYIVAKQTVEPIGRLSFIYSGLHG